MTACKRCGAEGFTEAADFFEEQNAAVLCVSCARAWLVEIVAYDGADLRVFVGTATETERIAEAVGRVDHERHEAKALARIEQAEHDAEAQAAKRTRRPIVGSAGRSGKPKAPDGPGYRERLVAEALAKYDAVADRLVAVVQAAHPRPVGRTEASQTLGEPGHIIGKAVRRAEARGDLVRDGKRGYVLPPVAA